MPAGRKLTNTARTADVHFHGRAGDPTADAVVIWTRTTNRPVEPLPDLTPTQEHVAKQSGTLVLVADFGDEQLKVA